MTAKAVDVADWMLSRVDLDAGDAITHLKLQKLVYYAQAWHLAYFDKPIFEEDLKAWTHGPVATTVWHKYKEYGWNALPASEKVPDFQRETLALLAAVYDSYSPFSAKQLEEMTHREDPWIEARGSLPLEARCDTHIKKQTMAQYYRTRIPSVGARSEN